MDGPRRRARRYFAPVLTDVGLYDVWKTVQRVLTRAASLEGAMDAMLWFGSGNERSQRRLSAKSRYIPAQGFGVGDDHLRATVPQCKRRLVLMLRCSSWAAS